MEEANVPVSMAIIGRPNVGKSSLLNSLVGKERSIVSSMAGTTRDAIDTDIQMPDGRCFKLIDTAGVRKRASIASGKDGAEPLSVERAFHAVRRAEVAVLVIDASEGVTQQDFRLSEYVAAEGRACVVVVNKWDKVPDKGDRTLSEFEANVRAELRPVEWANIVFTSALTGQRVKRVLDAATAAAEEHRRRITTATLNMVIQDATGWRAPPSTGQGRRGRVYYGTQAGVKPPTFVLFCNDPKLFPEDYRKYMERQFREQIGYPGSPLRIFYRGRREGTDAE
jgi:GTP-binding protein